jgi:indoleamine 2,3-dioxygenase
MSAVQSEIPLLKTEPWQLPAGTNPFEITAHTGFLPSRLPPRKLPPAFDVLSNILDEMPIQKENGEPGLLATFKLGPLIDSGKLPDLTDEIDNLKVPGSDKVDMEYITAAFRDYSFVASAYLLEPCWEAYSLHKADKYGLGRPVLPKCIAGPLVKCAKM